MPRTLRSASAIIALLAASALLVGCGGESTTGTGGGSGGSAGGESLDAAIDAAGGDTACLLGTWDLQTEAYTAQSLEWTRSQGVQIDALQIGGSYTLYVRDDGIEIHSDLVTDGVVRGIPFTTFDRYTGQGSWWWEDTLDSAFTITDWRYDGEYPGSEGGPLLIDPLGGRPFQVECAGDTLQISGPDAPLTGTFARRAE